MIATLPGLRVGLPCEVAIESAGGFGEYKSRIEDFQDDRLMLAMPTSRGAPVVPATGDTLQVIVQTPSGSTLYLDAEVVSRQSQPLPLLIVRVLAVGHQQARGYFRVSVTIKPFECSLWDRTGGSDGAFWRPVHATIQDMSGGGLGLLVDEEVPEGARLKVRFPMPYGAGECAGTGEVKLSRRARGDSRERRWTLGLQLNEVPRHTREQLVKAVHRFQAEERRREVDLSPGN